MPPLFPLFLSMPKSWIFLVPHAKNSVGDLEIVDRGEEEEGCWSKNWSCSSDQEIDQSVQDWGSSWEEESSTRRKKFKIDLDRYS